MKTFVSIDTEFAWRDTQRLPTIGILGETDLTGFSIIGHIKRSPLPIYRAKSYRLLCLSPMSFLTKGLCEQSQVRILYKCQSRYQVN